MKLFEIEQILIASAFKFGFDATRFMLPDLTPDKFIYGIDGTFGATDHRTIWHVVHDAVLSKHLEPNIFLLPDTYREYVTTLTNALTLYEVDANFISTCVEAVDKAGVIYQVARQSKAYGSLFDSETLFLKNYETVDDLNNWLGSVHSSYSNIYRENGNTYKPLSAIVDQVKERWYHLYNGDQVVLLPVGLPSFLSHQLFPVETFAAIHGLSSSGKSALVLQTLIGTALGLVINNIKGCVALNSLEMSEFALVSRASAMLSGIDWSRLIGGKEPLTEEEFIRLNGWLEFVGKLPLFLDSTSFITTNALQYRITDLYSGINGPVWQLASDYIELFGDEADSREQEVSQVARNHFHLAKKLGMSVIAVSQSTPSSKTMVAGYDEMRYSKAITHAADIVLFVLNYPAMDARNMEYKPLEDSSGIALDTNTAWCIVQKYRDGGELGAFPLGWQGEFTRFFDLNLKDNNHNILLFEHLRELESLKAKLNTRVVDIHDTPLAVWS